MARGIRSNDKLYKLITMGGQQVLMTQKAELSHLWHRRYGHLNMRALKYLFDNGMVAGIPKIGEIPSVCEPRALGKHARTPFPKASSWRAKQILELVHCDLWEPAQVNSLGGSHYFMSLIDDYSRKC